MAKSNGTVALNLIQAGEKFWYESKEIPGAKFLMRRIPIKEKSNYVASCTDRRTGVTKWTKKVGLMAIEASMYDWEGIGVSGEPIAFAKELVKQLPEGLLTELQGPIGMGPEDLGDFITEEKAKN